MPTYLLLLHEPDGRTRVQTVEETLAHQQLWDAWLAGLKAEDRLAGGAALSLHGFVLAEAGGDPQPGPRAHGQELVGGYLLLRADSLNEAVALARECPALARGGLVEVREPMGS